MLIYIEGIPSEHTLSSSLMDPAFVSVVRAVDGQETGLSVQPAAKKNRPGISSQSTLVQAFLLLMHQPTGQLKRTRPLTSYPVSQSRPSLQITKLVTCFHRPGRSLNTFSELTSSVIPVPALQSRPCCQ